MSSSEGAVLLTGATGFVGMELMARYLERTERPIVALVRATDDAAARGPRRRCPGQPVRRPRPAL